MQGKNKYVYVVINAYDEPCRAFSSEQKALDYSFALQLIRKKYHFEDIDEDKKFRIIKLCLE